MPSAVNGSGLARSKISEQKIGWPLTIAATSVPASFFDGGGSCRVNETGLIVPSAGAVPRVVPAAC